ncbi:hypothetical protein [Corynebacterium appendicis]|nr:hypothetical protein [Corynebacterium appendicis]
MPTATRRTVEVGLAQRYWILRRYPDLNQDQPAADGMPAASVAGRAVSH